MSEWNGAAAMSLLSEGQLSGFALGFLFLGDFCTESFRPIQIPPSMMLLELLNIGTRY